MKSNIKCMKLDLLLLKPYLKSILIVLMIPIIITFFYGSWLESLLLAVTILSMTTGYTFSVAEKNNLERFYGLLPVTRTNFVIGRYLAVFIPGFTAISGILALQITILSLRYAMLPLSEVYSTFLICLLIFTFYVCILIPGYYRFGSIKGKLFIFLPTIGILLLQSILDFWNKSKILSGIHLSQNKILLTLTVFVLLAVLILLSAFLSIRILEKKREKQES